eukprot:IDg11276t1
MSEISSPLNLDQLYFAVSNHCCPTSPAKLRTGKT